MSLAKIRSSVCGQAAALIAWLALTTLPLPAFAKSDTPTIVRDAELENTIRLIATPLFEAAGLTGENVHTYVIGDKSLNAFVAGGQNVFVNTGLIMAADNVNQLAGVIAHETGHITGGHLARFQEGLKGASAIAIAGMLLGAVAMAMGGGDAGMAVMMGSQEAAQRAVLAYSRTQEAAADQAGMTFLDATHQSGQGLVDFFERLSSEELLYTTNRDPYVRSHPLTRDRINALSGLVEKSPYKNAPNPPGLDDLFLRMKAKLIGYFQPPYVAFQKYPLSDQSLYARYARAYAYNQQHDMGKAMAETDSLLTDYPNDPYFWELKGFLLFDNGKIVESVAPFRRSIALSPHEPLILLQLAQALIAMEDDALNAEAITHLEMANRFERDSPFAWHQLSIAYHRAGQEGMAHLAAAERFLLIGMTPQATAQGRHAMEKLKRGTPQWLRAQDIVMAAGDGEMPDENAKSKNKNRKPKEQ